MLADQSSEHEDSGNGFGPLRAGAVVSGKYRLTGFLGSGGVGTVHAAQHVGLGERVALKFLHSRWASDGVVVERFLREARTQFRIASDHVPRLLDIDTSEWGAPFMVMELVEGESVRDLLDREGSVRLPYAAEIVRQACVGLTAAHDLGIVHRDVKAANLMLATRSNGEECVKLLDFGLAGVRLAVEDRVLATRLTPTSAVMGTPFYMAPEQLRAARSATMRSDVWSMGVVLYELLAGVRPYDIPALADLMHERPTMPPRALHEIRPELPRAVSELVSRCLAVDPAKRHADAGELALALAPFAKAFTRAQLAAPPPSIVRSRTPMTFARVKVRSDDGRTAFEVHELVGVASSPPSSTPAASSVPSSEASTLDPAGMRPAPPRSMRPLESPAPGSVAPVSASLAPSPSRRAPTSVRPALGGPLEPPPPAAEGGANVMRLGAIAGAAAALVLVAFWMMRSSEPPLTTGGVARPASEAAALATRSATALEIPGDSAVIELPDEATPTPGAPHPVVTAAVVEEFAPADPAGSAHGSRPKHRSRSTRATATASGAPAPLPGSPPPPSPSPAPTGGKSLSPYTDKW